MSKYFTEVEFSDVKDPGLPERQETIIRFNKDKIKATNLVIKEEFNKIKSGTSDYVTYGINPGSFGFSCENKLKIFEAKPTEENYHGFLQLATQDFGIRVAAYFTELLEACKEEVPNV